MVVSLDWRIGTCQAHLIKIKQKFCKQVFWVTRVSSLRILNAFVNFLRFFIFMSRCVRHHILKNLLIYSHKIPIKPVPFCFLVVNRRMHSITCKLSIAKITFVLTAVIEKQVPLAVSFKFFNIAIVNLTHWVLDSRLAHNLTLDPIGFNNLTFGQSQFSLPMKLVQK